jgi:uncharacterized SAM-binding protein YcdF (DUF218 family)
MSGADWNVTPGAAQTKHASELLAGPTRWLPIRLKRSLAVIALIGILIFWAGFSFFVWRVPKAEVTLGRNADGIVVVTGGALRITDAIELLSAGRGKRLLISGVHPATTSREIARLMPEYGALIACCVDLDHSAVNTVGNAVETQHWAKAHGFQSLIVVTSNYHMPRTMAELAWHLPDVELIPFPVVTERMRGGQVGSMASARLLFAEYLKSIFSQIRMRLAPAPAATDVASGASHS